MNRLARRLQGVAALALCSRRAVTFRSQGSEPDDDPPAPPTPSSRVRGGTLYAAEVDDAPEPSPAGRRAGRGFRPSTVLTALMVAAGLALPGVAAFLLRPAVPPPMEEPMSSPHEPQAPGETTALSSLERSDAPTREAREEAREGVPAARAPVRVCVLRFRSLGAHPELVSLEEALAEAVVTDVGQHPGLRIIERTQVDLPIRELDFSHGRYVDPETRARLGRIAGAEVVVLGSLQREGNIVRAAARFVHVETGEVLDAARVEAPAQRPFLLQDLLAARVRELLPGLPRRLRP